MTTGLNNSYNKSEILNFSISCFISIHSPGFKKLFTKKTFKSDDIHLELGEAKNANSLAICDRKMQELEKEIKKIAPSGNVVNVKILSKATNTVNEKIRNQGLSAKEILFSRDQFSQKNLDLQDDSISKLVMESRDKNNPYSSKSKSTTKKPAIPANARKGNVVFLKHDGDKHSKRDLYLVVEGDASSATVDLCKIIIVYF